MAGTSASLAGSVTVSTVQRTNMGSEGPLTVTDAVAVNLTVPVGANVAEMSILDGSQLIIFRTNGIAPTNSPQVGLVAFQHLELESVDELNNFSAIAPTGQTVRLYIEYKADAQASNN